MKKTLNQIHEDVPADHYDIGFKKNPFQHFWHSSRIREIKKIIPKNLGKVLDVGCHSGFLSSRVIVDYKNLYGIDISTSAINLAKNRIKNASFLVADAYDLPFKKSFFDTIFCIEVLEHLENPGLVVKEIKKVLKNKGNLIILIPNSNILFKSIWYIWNIFFPVWKHAHAQNFTQKSIIKILKAEGFRIDRINKFNLNMLLLIKAQKP